MKTKLAVTALAAGIFFAGSTHAGSLNFRIEIGALTLPDSTALTSETPGVTIYSAVASAATLTGLSFSSDAATLISELQAASTNAAFTNPSDGSPGWDILGAATGPIANANEWNEAYTDLATGLHPVFLAATSPLGSLTTADSVGLVFSVGTPVASDFSADTITFASGWDTAVLGTLTGTPGLELAPVPEPSTYAAIFGLGVLGLALYRRRRS